MRLSKVSKNIAWILACRIAQAVFALIINSVTARYFGPTNYGVISYAASLVAFVTPLMKLGTTEIIVNELIQQPEKEGEVLGTSIVMTMGTSLLCILGLFSFVNIANHGEPTTILTVLLYSLLLLSQSMEQIQYWFHAKYLSKTVSLTTLAVYFLISGYKIILLLTGKSVYWFAASNALDHFIVAVILMIAYKRKDGQPLRFSAEAMKRLWRNGKLYVLPEMMGLVLQQSDRIMLQFFSGNDEVGLYASALSIATMTSFIFTAIIGSYRPLILESKIESAEKYGKNMAKLHGIVVYLAILQCIFVVLFSKPIVYILYGQAYLPSITMLRIVIFYTVFSYVGALRSLWILAEGKQRYLWIISLSGMLLNVALNFVLIHYWGGEGAAFATLITQVFTNIVIIALVKPLRAHLRFLWNGMMIKKWI